MVIDNSLKKKRVPKEQNAPEASKLLKNHPLYIFSSLSILDFYGRSISTSMIANVQKTIVLLNRLPFQFNRTSIYVPLPRKFINSTTYPQRKNIIQLQLTAHANYHNLWASWPLQPKLTPIYSSGEPSHLVRESTGCGSDRGRKGKGASEDTLAKGERQQAYSWSSEVIEPQIEVGMAGRQYFQNSDPQQGSFCLAQSKQIMLDDSLDDLLLAFKNSLRKLRKSGIFSYLDSWTQVLQGHLAKLISSWDLYDNLLRKELILFLRVHEYKMLRAGCSILGPPQSEPGKSLYELIYPSLTSFLRQTLDILSLQSLEGLKQQFIKDHQEDSSSIQNNCELQDQFLQEIKEEFSIQYTKETDEQLFVLFKSYHLFLSDQKSLPSSFLAELQKALEVALSLQLNEENILGNSEFNVPPTQNMLNKLLYNVKERLLQKKSKVATIKAEEQQRVKTFFHEIQNEKLIDANCLGCCKFFYKNLNIFDENLCRIPLRAFPSINIITDIQHELKDSICAMLNCGGGIILFDCQLSSRELIAKGFFLTELKKESEERRIGSYLKCFYPPLEINKHVQISFVPIVNNPYSSDNSGMKQNYAGEEGAIKQYEWYFERSYVRGYFVTRIRVRPSDGTQVFYWFRSKKTGKEAREEEIEEKYCCAFDGEKIKYLTTQEMNKLIKRKFGTYFIPITFTQAERSLLAKPFDVFGHVCEKPESGVQVAESEVKEVKSEMMAVKDFAQKVSHTIYELKYPNMILLIVHKNHLDLIKEKLASLKISCEIERRFESHNLRPAFNSAILYHSGSFDLVFKHLAGDSQFNFQNGKPMMLIDIKPYLKLERDAKNIPSKADIERYESWLRKEFSSEKLKLMTYTIDRRKKEFYLTTGSKLSTLFLYFMLGHNNEKVVFRNPACVDKPDAQGNKLEIFYQSPQAN